jgi:sortase (surface protein transpeptidase)
LLRTLSQLASWVAQGKNAMLDRLQELWAERPAVVAAAVIAPLAFVITLLVLFLAVDGGQDSEQQQGLAAQQSADQQTGQAQTSTAQQATIVLQTSADDDQEQAAAQSQQADSSSDTVSDSEDASASQQSDGQESTNEQQQAEEDGQQAQADQGPLIVAGRVVEPLDEVLSEEVDDEALRHGTDGSEGGILPIDNGVVVSSQPEHQTRWELIVPSAGLKSTIVQVGRTPTGAMGSPDNPHVIGWLNSSAEPGEVGNTLLAGHRDFEDRDGNVGTGVCWELVNTVVGDQMIVRDNESNIYFVYTVTEAVTVNPRDRASAKYLRNADEPVITLITCEGSFNADTHQYSHRRVVVGVLAAVASPDA